MGLDPFNVFDYIGLDRQPRSDEEITKDAWRDVVAEYRWTYKNVKDLPGGMQIITAMRNALSTVGGTYEEYEVCQATINPLLKQAALIAKAGEVATDTFTVPNGY